MLDRQQAFHAFEHAQEHLGVFDLHDHALSFEAEQMWQDPVTAKLHRYDHLYWVKEVLEAEAAGESGKNGTRLRPPGPDDNRKEAVPVMDRLDFLKMLSDFRLFPQVVARDSAVRHFQAVEARPFYKHEEIGYDGFLEAICRIGFAQLSVYGNVVQQKATSRRKLHTLLTWLRAGYEENDLGPTSDWSYDKLPVDIDNLPVEDLVFFELMKRSDAEPLLTR